MERFLKLDGKIYTESEINEMSVSEITNLIADIYAAISDCNTQEDKLRFSKSPCGSNNVKISRIRSAKRLLNISIIWIGNIKKQKNIQAHDSRESVWRQCVSDVCDKKVMKKIEEEYSKRVSK